MPVILTTPSEPQPSLLGGEQIRMAAMAMDVNTFALMIAGSCDALATGPMSLVGGEKTYAPMAGGHPVPPREILRDIQESSMVSDNSCICTPCGAILPKTLGSLMLDPFVEATNSFAISGITKDASGAALGNCRVVVFETGKLVVLGPALVAETTSDGSGNYSVPVALNTGHQLVAYRPGAPDVAGVTRSDVAPTHVG